MCSTCLHTYEKPTLTVNVNKADPTRTTTLRNAFAKDLAKRFRVLRGRIRQAIVKENILGAVPIQANVENFAFTRRSEKAEEFMQWLEGQVKKELLTTSTMPQLGTAIDKRWTDMYVADSYNRGVQRSRYEMVKAGYSVPSIEQSGGINAVMSTPFHMDRVGVIYTRVFEELKGITAAMDTQISRVLAEGMINGDNPNLLASKINAAISGRGLGDLGITDTLGRFIPAERRATIMARTEVIRAHHLAMVQEYRNFGVAGVEVQAEWSTAGDARVCPECLDLENKVFSLKEIEGMIPKHPQCRCIALPKKVENEKDVKAVEVDEVSLFDAIPTTSKEQWDWIKDPKNGWRTKLKVDDSDVIALLEEHVGSGFNFRQMTEEINNLLIRHNTPLTTKRMQVTKERIVYSLLGESETGGSSFQLIRIFEKKVVNHEYFELSESLQGTGLSKEILKSFFKQYKASGINKIELLAGLDVGGYAWGKYGFFTDDISYLRRRLNGSSFSSKDWKNDAENIISNFESANPGKPFPMNLLADAKFGKDFLLGSSWDGFLDLDDKKATDRFIRYMTTMTRTKYTR